MNPPWDDRDLSRAESWVAGHEATLVALSAGAAAAVGFARRFVQDDAFISFQYARNLVEGQGLTWFGTRIEGYTDFLWVLWIALGFRLGIEPVAWSYAGGISAFVATVVAAYFLARRALDSRLLAAVTVVLLVCNFTVQSFATGGLETMAQTALVVMVAGLAWGRLASAPSPGVPVAATGLLAALAVLTRLDSVVLLAGILGGAGVVRRIRWARMAGVAVVGAVPVGAWLAWKWWYYGRLLPNSYYAKVVDWNLNGLVYLGRFMAAYWIWPFLVLGLIGMVHYRRRLPPALAPVLTTLLLWIAYIVYVRGDFMEFRFLVPVMPFLFVLIAYLAAWPIGADMSRHPGAVLAMSMALLLTASQVHGVRFTGIARGWNQDSVGSLATFYGVYPDGDFRSIGVTLGEALQGTGAVLGVHAAGAIPYYSRLRSIDMWGLNDARIPVEGTRVPWMFWRPGHRRHATLHYLRAARVTFIIGHPSRLPDGYLHDPGNAASLAQWLNLGGVFFNTEPIESATLVSIPLGNGSNLLTWYLTPTAEIDRLIESRHWERAELRPREKQLIPLGPR